MDFSTLNWLAVLLSTLIFFALGALWYNPMVFGKLWMKEAGIPKETTAKANMPKIMGLTLLFTFVMVLNLALFLNDPKIGATEGAMYGFFTGFGWVAMAIFVTGQYEFRSTRYMLIHAGYNVVGFTIVGLLLGAWK
ncbi:MAG: DUF1761 domain-containing protein [Bacteroidales bacterium]